jgi:hypothetical protein
MVLSFILSSLFADLVKRLNVKSGGLATRSRADPGLNTLVIPADGRLLIFIR